MVGCWVVSYCLCNLIIADFVHHVAVVFCEFFVFCPLNFGRQPSTSSALAGIVDYRIGNAKILKVTDLYKTFTVK